MGNFANNEQFIQGLLQQRDELYGELSRMQNIVNNDLAKLELKNKDLETRLEKKDDLINEKDENICKKDEQIKKLTDQLAWYRRKLWKPSSERYIIQDPNQRRIDFDGLELLPEEKQHTEQADKELISYQRNKPKTNKRKAVRLSLSEDLRREEETIEPEGLQEDWVCIGKEITEVLIFNPGEVYVRKIVRPKYIVPSPKVEVETEAVEKTNICVAKLPLLPIPRSNVGASLLAELLINKFQYHLPFHRQIEMFKSLGVSLPASTVNDWFKRACDLLRALYDRLRDEILSSDYIQIDESTVPVINNEKHKTVKSYLWMVRSVMKNLVCFHYDKGSRAQKVVVELLIDFQGAVQADGYQAYSIYEQKKGVLLLGCWAHARRKFEESLKEDKTAAEYALAQIGKLYQIETMATEQGLDDEQRGDLRKRLAYPILCAFEKWILNYYPKVLPKGKIGSALYYTYNLFHRLSRYHLDGRYKLDNNLAENAIRPLALGRKNYLFCGNHEAAENAAVMYSLLGCCKASDVDPRKWLTDVLERIPTYNDDYSLDLAELLPHNWKLEQEKKNTSEPVVE